MSYFAAAVVREPEGWRASEVSLTDAADVEDVADRLREVASDADVSLLFVESDDSYLVILRLDGGEDLRVFGSDAAFAEESRLGALLLGDVQTPSVDPVEPPDGIHAASTLDVEEEVGGVSATDAAVAEPAGDAELLTDLGVPADRLLALCSHEGMLPSDITAEVCQAIGAGDEIEELRE